MRCAGAQLVSSAALVAGILVGLGSARAQPASLPASSQPASAPSSQPASRPALPDWAPRLSATVKPASARLGDPVAVEITTRHAKGISVTLPLQLELGKFVELSRADRRRDLGGDGGIPSEERTFSLKVAAYELGELTLPPIELNALGPGGELVTVKTEAVPINVTSVLRNEPNAKPKGLAPPVQVFERTWWLLYLIIALAAAGLVATVTLLVARHLRRRREREAPPPPPVPAHIVALGRLAEIDLEAYVAGERFKELYLLLSEIMRQYVGGRWGFDALEMTTTEVNAALERVAVDGEVRRRLETYLSESDLVKFAKYKPPAETAAEALAEAKALVRETMQVTPAVPHPGDRQEKQGDDGGA